jgi:cell pole-organizing protein PopZ
MEEILASIRRIIADDQELPAAHGSNGAAGETVPETAPAAQPLAEDGALVSPKTNSSVNSAFNALVASRFVQHSDAIMALTHEMLRPMLKAWLDEHLSDLVERLVKEEIERLSQG